MINSDNPINLYNVIILVVIVVNSQCDMQKAHQSLIGLAGYLFV